MNSAKILVVDDEKDVRDYLISVLSDESFEVRGVEDGDDIISVLSGFAPNIILLDYSLPGKSGVEIIRVVRENRNFSDIPIIMVTGLDGEEEKVAALELGADDYVVKPFSPKELSARVRAVLRRVPADDVERLENGDLVVDLRSHKVMLSGSEVYLTLTEFRILTELLRQKGKVLTRDRLRETALGNLNVTDRTIDVHMASLRKKLAQYAPSIETVRGVGYRYSMN
ncbi:MAG: response regulator transcription factor [Bdellovibrionaceae bacterium]|nr:response regulator transcription factor [Bdellovibrionales bacterium]MCB9085568.1 response regulator transcription factor [Pseudobdellovibrionaceae bacterium]